MQIYGLFLVSIGLLVGCKPGVEPVSVVNSGPVLPAQASLVSVQATGASTAEIIVKTSRSLNPTDWQLTSESLTLTLGSTQTLDLFALTTVPLTGLTVGKPYQLRLRFLYNNKDTLTVGRTYTHQPNTFWKRLTPIPIAEGDFTGSLVLNNTVSFLQSPTGYLAATRYLTDEQGDAWLYDFSGDNWLISRAFGVIPHNQVQFQVQAVKGVVYTFYGLGYLNNDQIPGKRIYLKKMGTKEAGPVHPDYAGKDGEVAFFTTIDRAFFLTQEGSREFWVRRGTFDQYQGSDFPENPGTLATFTLNGIGYIVNQLDGQVPHLWAYDPPSDHWVRRADFPGGTRSRGVGFSASGKGYFGLGITGDDEKGLRDIWQYDPVLDQWTYVTDYPGQGNRYLVVYSANDRAYLGWGYESQMVPSGGSRVVGCTDFWQFKP